MRKINYNRLLKLATHLEKGKLGHRKFNFGLYNDKEFKCGTSGCAIGECPIAFPKDWEFRNDQIVCLVNQRQSEFSDGYDMNNAAAKKFFGITEAEYCHLFLPTPTYASTSDIQQNVRKYGGSVLGVRAKKEQVAANIRAFVKVMRKKTKEHIGH